MRIYPKVGIYLIAVCMLLSFLFVSCQAAIIL